MIALDLRPSVPGLLSARQSLAARCGGDHTGPRGSIALRSLPGFRHRRGGRASSAAAGGAHRVAAPGCTGTACLACSTHWFDKVLARGWPTAKRATPCAARPVCGVTTTGGDDDAFSPQGMHAFPFGAFVPPVEQTARFCQMHWAPPLVLHGAHRIGTPELEAAGTALSRAIDHVRRTRSRAGGCAMAEHRWELVGCVDLPRRRRDLRARREPRGARPACWATCWQAA